MSITRTVALITTGLVLVAGAMANHPEGWHRVDPPPTYGKNDHITLRWTHSHPMEHVQLAWTSLPGSSPWIAVVPQHAPDDPLGIWQYTRDENNPGVWWSVGAQRSGQRNIGWLRPPGTWEIRVYPNRVPDDWNPHRPWPTNQHDDYKMLSRLRFAVAHATPPKQHNDIPGGWRDTSELDFQDHGWLHPGPRTYRLNNGSFSLGIRYSKPGRILGTVGSNAQTPGDFRLSVTREGNLRFAIWNQGADSPLKDTAGWHNLDTDIPLEPDRWYNVLVSYGQEGMAIHIDGRIVAEEDVKLSLSGRELSLGQGFIGSVKDLQFGQPLTR